MKTIIVNDRVSYAITRREITDEGFMRVPGRVARTGVQEYLAGELGLDGDPMRIIRVMRPADEVFNEDSLASYLTSDVTVEHPSTMVNASTFKDVSVGTVITPGTQDGDFVVADLIVKDQAAIAAVNDGKVQLSAGYSAMYDDNVPEGADYEFIQRNIRINHVALVDRARAGGQARLFDNKPKVNKMPVKITLDSGRDVTVEDDATAALIGDAFDRKDQKIDDLQKSVDKVTADRDSLKEQLDDAKKLASSEAISAQVNAVLSTIDSARKLAGKTFQTDSTDIPTIQREALAVKRPKIAWADKSDTYVQVAWDQGLEETKEDLGIDEEEERESNDSHAKLAADAAKVGQNNEKSHRANFNDSMSNSWKKTAGVDK